MKAIDLNTKYLDKFLNILLDFDDKAKKYVIDKLQSSMKKKQKKEEDFDIDKVFGSWEDSRSTEEIIKDIYDSRVSKPDPISFD